MLFVLWVPLLLQLVIPLGLLAWLGFGDHATRLTWVLTAMLMGFYLGAITTAGLWLILPWYTPLIYGVLFLLALVHSLAPARTRSFWPEGRHGLLAVIVRGGLTVLFGGIALYAVAGRRPPAAAVNLTFPLRGGTYLVVNGGKNVLVNAHLETLTGDRYRAWRGQSYGVDIEKLDRYGFRARGIVPHDPAAYAIFGETIYAPCAGAVMTALDGVQDMHPPETDRQHMAGNHVILDCGGVWILMGHLQQGSVLVRTGEQVVVGQPLARVGNTGNTGEPHLHLHAQRPGTPDAPLGGDPLPIRFGGTYPVRNARVRVPS
jgi:Peptidase family M23